MLRTRDDYIYRYQEYTKKLARKLQLKYHLPLEYLEDMEAAGYLGLVEAASRYEPDRGVDFGMYAYHRIRGAILDAVRRSSHMSAPAYRALKAYQSLNDIDVPTREAEGLSTKQELARLLELAAKGALIYHLCLEQEDLDDLPEEWGDLLKHLPERERLLIYEHYFNDRSLSEVAELLGGVSKSWVSRMHANAIKHLREIYTNRF